MTQGQLKMNLYEMQNKKWCHVNLLSSVGPDHKNLYKKKDFGH